MKRTSVKLFMAATVIATSFVQLAYALDVGAEAPEVKPSTWLNHKGAISWKELRGRLVLVEKWSTT